MQEIPPQLKTCSKCKIEKTIDQFHIRKLSSDGLEPKCKSCKKKYYNENKESILVVNKEWKNNNKDKNNIYAKKSYLKHSDIKKKRNKIWREENKDKISIQKKSYRLSTNGKASKINSNHKRRLITKNNTTSTLDIAKLMGMAYNCYWCETSLKDKKIHLDHYIPLSKGGTHSVENIVISCSRCNQEKHAKDPILFANSIGKLL